jgi:beta-lactamase class A
MRIIKSISLSIFCLSLIVACKTINKSSIEILKKNIKQQIETIEGDIAVSFLDLSNEENLILINADKKSHAASTMKVLVMIDLYKHQNEGLINLKDSIVLVIEFKSIVDERLYNMAFFNR